MRTLCFRAQEALIAGEVTPELEAHIEACASCDRVRQISALLVVRTSGHTATSVRELLCSRAQQALIAGEVTPEFEAHIVVCATCSRLRRFPDILVARPPRHTTTSVRAAFVCGQELLNYRLDDILGEGGQGVVFKATEIDLPESVVALKIVHHVQGSVNEVLAKRINHRNVVRVNHTAVYGRFRLIEMEYVAGGTLKRRLETEPPLSPEQVVAIFRGVLNGLEAVHQKQILHLDLKPLNILLREGIEPVLTDFGMSTQAGGEVHGGTRGWTAPEITRGEQADVSADIYSLGALLEALEPSGAFGKVIKRAKSPLPEQRYPDVASLRAAFEEAIRRNRSLPPRRLVVAAGAPGRKHRQIVQRRIRRVFRRRS